MAQGSWFEAQPGPRGRCRVGGAWAQGGGLGARAGPKKSRSAGVLGGGLERAPLRMQCLSDLGNGDTCLSGFDIQTLGCILRDERCTAEAGGLEYKTENELTFSQASSVIRNKVMRHVEARSGIS